MKTDVVLFETGEDVCWAEGQKPSWAFTQGVEGPFKILRVDDAQPHEVKKMEHPQIVMVRDELRRAFFIPGSQLQLLEE